MSGALEARLTLARGGFLLDVDLRLSEGGIVVVFGPSGSGKTSLLRAIAGLEPAARGRVRVGSAVWQDDAAGVCEPVWRRQVGYVFQEASLFEHLDVRGNIAYGLRWRPGSGEGPDAIAERIGIGALLDRRVDTLSGGERQRVAIARALAVEPSLLLLDEPLSALDWERREEVMDWLQEVQRQCRVPMLYVTHSPDELARLADAAVVLREGRVVATGAPEAALREAGSSKVVARLRALRG